MFNAFDLKVGGLTKPAAVLAKLKTEEFLNGVSFLGREQPITGNFSLWESLGEAFADMRVMKFIRTYLSSVWEKEQWGDHSLHLTFDQPVGWERTAPRDDFSDRQLEIFRLAGNSPALRLKDDLLDIKAPKTSELTIVARVRPEKVPVDSWCAKMIILHMYPGVDIGPLGSEGSDLRESRVFFPKGHPGEL